jgi:hypothetical protein
MCTNDYFNTGLEKNKQIDLEMFLIRFTVHCPWCCLHSRVSLGSIIFEGASSYEKGSEGASSCEKVSKGHAD